MTGLVLIAWKPWMAHVASQQTNKQKTRVLQLQENQGAIRGTTLTCKLNEDTRQSLYGQARQPNCDQLKPAKSIRPKLVIRVVLQTVIAQNKKSLN